MRLKIIFIGKTTEKYLQQGIDEYVNRMKHYIKSEVIIIPEIKNKKYSRDQLKEEEAKLVLAKLNSNDQIIVLDELGKEFSSNGFAQFFARKMNQSVSSIALVIGGAYGVSESLLSKSTNKIALSQMTFTHQMVRLILVEQIYRAFTILKGEKYHH